MLFNVPQYIDVEDKVAGPLTAKQLGWMIGMGAALLVMWNIIPKGYFWVAAVPVICFFVALAFYKPYNLPLISFVSHTFAFLFRPKIYLWDRPGTVMELPKRSAQEKPQQDGSRVPTTDKIKELSEILDRNRSR